MAIMRKNWIVESIFLDFYNNFNIRRRNIDIGEVVLLYVSAHVSSAKLDKLLHTNLAFMSDLKFKSAAFLCMENMQWNKLRVLLDYANERPT